MHGLGNDFILIEDLAGRVNLNPRRIGLLCDRRYGIGADGILLVKRSSRADARMRVFNPDGSEAEMCGNGIRCFARFLRRRGLVRRDELKVQTGAGVLQLNIKGEMVEVEMGRPELLGEKIPLRRKGKVVNQVVKLGRRNFRITCLSMGNPHCVIFYPPPVKPEVARWGPLIEKDRFFPRKTNVEFVRVLSRRKLKVDVWERGAGITPACGTGACASLVAAALIGKTERRATVLLPGGELEIEWREDGQVLMTGPAAFVFEGEIDI